MKNWKSNQKMTGFILREREWLTHVFERHGFVDVFRKVDPSPAVTARKAVIYAKPVFSDHAPLVIDYEFTC